VHGATQGFSGTTSRYSNTFLAYRKAAAHEQRSVAHAIYTYKTPQESKSSRYLVISIPASSTNVNALGFDIATVTAPSPVSREIRCFAMVFANASNVAKFEPSII